MLPSDVEDVSTVPQQPRLFDPVRDKTRVKHYSIRTEQACLNGVRRYIRCRGRAHLTELGAVARVAVLAHLALQRNISPSMQTQATNALMFLRKEVLEIELAWLDGIASPRKPRRLAVVLSHTEVHEPFGRMPGTTGLIARLLYGSGLRLMDGVHLLVKDLDLRRRALLVGDRKGGTDRVTALPENLSQR